MSQNLASRDLKALSDRGLLISIGDRRGRSYVASEAIKGIRDRVREPRTEEDPFSFE